MNPQELQRLAKIELERRAHNQKRIANPLVGPMLQARGGGNVPREPQFSLGGGTVPGMPPVSAPMPTPSKRDAIARMFKGGPTAPPVPQMAPQPGFALGGAPETPPVPGISLAAPAPIPVMPSMPSEGGSPAMMGSAPAEPVVVEDGQDIALTHGVRQDIARLRELNQKKDALYDWQSGNVRPGAEAALQELDAESVAIMRKYGGRMPGVSGAGVTVGGM